MEKNTIFVLIKSKKNLDLINLNNGFEIIGVFKSLKSAENKILNLGNNLNYQYQIQGPFYIEDNDIPMKPFIPPLIIPNSPPSPASFPPLLNRDKNKPDFFF